MEIIKPYDDDNMTYDINEHRYILTLDYVENKTGLNLVEKLNTSMSDNPQQVAMFFLDRISSNIYSWIYQHNANNDVQEWILAKVKGARTIIQRAMIEQVIYVLNNGDMTLYGGVNVSNGQVINKKDLHNADIGINVERILNTIIPDVGVALTYQGFLTMPLGEQVRSDY